MRLTIGPVAHGGHCVARHDGQVVFVRHTLPGEVVDAVVTGTGPKQRYLFADAVEIIEPAAGRIPSHCALAGPGGCGGCDWQHVDLPTQRELKAQVVAEQLRRLGGIDREIVVRPVPGDVNGLGWRTRVRYSVDGSGVGFRRQGSHDVIPVPQCPIATDGINAARTPDGVKVTDATWSTDHVAVVQDAESVQVIAGDGRVTLHERAAGRPWLVPGDGFWQVHPGAADALADLVVAALPEVGTVWDLYSGVGLFAGAYAQRHGAATVLAVESHAGAVRCARRNLADLPNATVVRNEVLRWLRQESGRDVDAVVVDPPRSGAGGKVLGLLTGSNARTLVYVACDPASLGRDTATLISSGWELAEIAGLDLFPMTHHVEVVAVFRRD